MRKIITFLGTSPKDTVYEWEGKPYPGKVFAEALRKFVNFDAMLVLTTREAAIKTWPLLEALQDARIQQIPIPDGKDLDEMWKIFQAVIAEVEQGETVIFDITHGFRSLPFLAFLFAAYLKTAKKVTIDAVYYGAFEMAAQNDGKAPVIDMSSFVNMLDWMTATDQFVQTGSAKQLAELLQPHGKKGGAAARASRTLSSVSMAAFLCQPFELMRSARELESALQNAESELEISAQPFGILREQIVSRFGRFNADYRTDPRAALCQEFQLLEWYFENGQLMQAITLAREWLIDAVAFRLDGKLDFSPEARKIKERAISGLSQVGRRDKVTKELFTSENLGGDGKIIWGWPEHALIERTWSAIQYPRNTLDHAGHQSNPFLTETVQRKVKKEILPGLQELAQKWDLC